MKAEELMRFDWVSLEDDDTPRQVDWIRCGEVGLFWDKTVTPPYLVPIPLTADILEKNGWEKCNIDTDDDDVQYGYDYGSFCFTWWSKVKLLGCYFEDKNAGLHYEMISEMPIKYVHQLQHAIKLCGIEKEIIL